MKKIYLLLLLCLLSFRGFSTRYYACVNNGDMTNNNTWNTSISCGSSLHPFLPGATNDTWFVQLPLVLPAGATFHIQGTLLFEYGSKVLREGAGTMNIDQNVYMPGLSTPTFEGPGYITSVPGAGPLTMTIGHDLTMLGTSHITDSTSSSTTINLGGNLYMGDNSYISSLSGGYTKINFNGLAPFATPQTITWTSTGASAYTRFEIDEPNNVALLSYVPLPTAPEAAGEVLNGTLICNTFGMIGDGTQNFYINGGAKIYTANTGGIDSSVQQCTDTFSTAANYTFNGFSPQITGISLPDSIVSAGAVTIHNPAGVTLSKGLTITAGTDSLNLENGVFNIGVSDSLLTVRGGNIYVDSGTFASAPTYIANPVIGANIFYYNLGINAMAITTGYELLPVATSGTITIWVLKLGATITLGSTPSVAATLVYIDAGTLDASASNYNLTVTEQWENASGPGAFVPRAGTVNFVKNGSGPCDVFGAFPTTFNNVTLNNNFGLIMANVYGFPYVGVDEYINGTLTLDTGNIYILDHNLIFDTSATAVVLPPSDTCRIIADSTGQVRKLFTADGTFLFPVGDSLNYTPITLAYSGSGGYDSGAYAGVNLRPRKEPRNADITNFINRYWTVTDSGIVAPSYTATYTYVPGDVVGIEGEIAAGADTGALPLVKYGLTTVATHTLVSGVMTVDSSVNFTGIDTIGPTLTLSDDTTLCIGGFDTLMVLSQTGDTPFTYTWAPATGLSATTGTVVAATPTVTTTYTVTITDGNGATGTDTVTVTVNGAPSLDSVYNTGPVCSGGTLTLIGYIPQNVTGYLWQGPAVITDSTSDTASIPGAYTTATGTYTVTVVDGIGSGCTMTYTTTATVDTFPDSTHVFGGGAYCDTTTIFAHIADTNTIYFQDTVFNGTSTAIQDSTALITYPGTYTYYFRALSPLGCWGPQGSVTVTLTASPLPDTAYGAGTFCDSAVIGASNGDSGTIYFQGTVHNGTSTSMGGTPQTVTAPGTYYFRAQSAAGCWAQEDSVTVNINYTPTPVTASGAGTFCGADSISATGGIGGVIYYQFDTSLGMDTLLGDSQIVVSASGTYFFRAENAGCWSKQDSVIVVVNPLPATVIITPGTPSAFCDSTTIFATNGGDGIIYYQDTFTNGISIAMPDSFAFIDSVGTYNYHFRAQNPGTGCWSNDTSVSITINPLPDTVNASGAGIFCGSAILNATDPDATVLIYFQGTGPGGTATSFGTPYTVNTSGTYYFRAQSTAGCWSPEGVSDDSVTVTVYPLPTMYNVSTGGSFCQGSPGIDITLDGSDTGITYQLYNDTTTVGTTMAGTGSPLDFGIDTVSGTYTVIATNNTTLCSDTTTTSSVVLENPLPLVSYITGGGAYCFGGTGSDLTIDSTEFGDTYNFYVNGVFNSSQTGLGDEFHDYPGLTDTGTYTIIAVTAAGCSASLEGSIHIATIPLPNLYAVSGGGVMCASDTGFHIFLSGSDTGTSYQLYNSSTLLNIGFPVTGAGLPIDFGLQANSGTYIVLANNPVTTCVNTMSDSAVIIVNPLPIQQGVTGGGSYCSGTGGLVVGVTGSEIGLSYQLYDNNVPTGTAIIGTGSAFNYPPQSVSGTYKVIATNPGTGCTDSMANTVLISINILPAVYTIFGGGSYCVGGAGFNIGFSGSQTGVEYTLSLSGTPVDSVAGTGFIDSFGHQLAPGSYTVTARDLTTSCTSNIAGTAVIAVNSLPVVDTVTGGGSFCMGGAGVHVFLSNSTIGIDYQLYRAGVTVGGAVPGISSAIDFGSFITTGTYKVSAMNVVTGCISNMADSATVSINALPNIYAITGGGSYCSGSTGVALGLSNSTTGIYYQLYHGTAALGSAVEGTTGSPINFGLYTGSGTYSVHATDSSTTCADSMAGTETITVNPLPPQHLVLGGGIYCSGGTGVDVSLSHSDVGYLYLLYDGGATVGPPHSGTGAALDFGLQTLAGTYTVIAFDTSTTCSDTMTDSAIITVEAPLIPVLSITAHPGTFIAVGQMDTLVATESGGGPDVTYQWFVNSNLVVGATDSVFSFTVYYNTDSITCQATSHGTCAGYTTSKSTFITLHNVGVQQVTAAGSDIKLIPNPNKGVFTVKGTLGTSNDEEVTIEITDMLGQVIYNEKVMATGGNINERIQLNSSLANGMYILNLSSGTQNNIFHFVIEQ